MVRAKRLSGINPLAYMGVEPDTPLQFVVEDRAPGERDYSNWNIGSIWLHDDTQTVYMLVAKDNLIATWIPFGTSSSGVQSITGDEEDAVFPNMALTIFLKSTFSPLSFEGNPLTNTLNLTSDGTIAVTYLLGPMGEDMVMASGGSLVIEGAGGIVTSGAGDTITISSGATIATSYETNSGTATPSGNILKILGDTGITTSSDGSNEITVSLTGAIATKYITNSGNAFPVGGELNVLGGSYINTAGDNSDTLTINMDNLGGPGVVITDAMGAISVIDGTDGQVIIGSGGFPPAWANITSGDGSVTITNGSNTIDLATTVSLSVNAGDNINITSPPTNTVNLNETIHWPSTNSAGTTGVIYLGGSGGSGGDRFMHNYGIDNTFLGTNSGNFTLNPTHPNNSALLNTGVGVNTLTSLTNGRYNTAVGANSITSNTAEARNSALGAESLSSGVTARYNTAAGYGSLEALSSGDSNVALGDGSLGNLVSGSFNVALGATGFNGGSYTGSESNNILIGNSGTNGESNKIRIGTDGSGDGQQNECYIAAIYGVTSSGGTAVYINSSGKLGTSTSSSRFKDNIIPMGAASSSALNLAPVTFTYKKDDSNEKQYGLIAEEVVGILPDIVTHGKDGLPDAVQYHKLIPMLLNEAQKLEKRLKALEDAYDG